MTWKFKEILSEAVRNLGPNQIGTGIVATIVLLAFGALTVMQAQAAVVQTVERQEAGGQVWTAFANADAPLSGAKCEALNQSRGVLAAGGIVIDESLNISTEYGIRIPLTVMTPHALWVWDSSVPLNAVIVGSDLEKIGYVSVGTEIVDEEGNIAQVSARTSRVVRSDVFTSKLSIPTFADQDIHQCWIKMEASSNALGGDLLSYTFGQIDGVQIAPFLPETEGIASPSQQWHAFVDVSPWAMVALTIALALTFGMWNRRAELAIYRTFGTSRAALAVLTALESIGVLVPAVSVSLLFLLAGFGGIGGQPVGSDIVQVLVYSLIAAACGGLALSIPLGLVVTAGSITTQLKDR